MEYNLLLVYLLPVRTPCFYNLPQFTAFFMQISCTEYSLMSYQGSPAHHLLEKFIRSKY